MAPRKRRHEQAFSDHEEVVPEEPDEETTEKARADKEQEVWDAIREAHYEAIEQLPLTLQRGLSLLRQLDEQTLSCNSRILSDIRKYIKLRQDLAGQSVPASGSEKTTEQPDGQPGEQPPLDSTIVTTTAQPTSQPNGQPNGRTNDALLTPSRRLRSGDTQQPVRTRTSTPMSLPPSERPKLPTTTRDLLTQVACMTEDFLRASQEKVNLAQANYDSVERHIHILDQAIKEQEASLSADPSKPSAAIHLPELVIPQWVRRRRDEEATYNDEYDGELEDQTNTPATEDPQAPNTKTSTKKKGKGGSENRKGDHGNDATALTITLPATQPVEELYCYCNRVSFGEMIACDNMSCEREWFHLGCVGLTEPPDGEWYCEDCREDE